MKIEDILFENAAAENKERLEKLKKDIKKDEWAFCLGAGASISAGLPDWYTLLAKITAQILEIEANATAPTDGYYEDVMQYYSQLETNADTDAFWKKRQSAAEGEYASVFSGINVLEAAEYIRKFLEDSICNTDDASQIEEERMEQRINWYMNSLIREACRTDVKVTDLETTTLGAVARLMASKYQIRNAITYNYDNLLETCLREICNCEKSKVHSIAKEDEIRDFGSMDEWNIYHVHGRIPVKEHPNEAESQKVILTESDYYQEEQINYSWTNIIQSYAIARSNLIYAGFSGADYNFRRIIKYVEKDKMRTRDRYIFFSVDDITKAVFQKELAGVSKEEYYDKLSKCIEEMNKPNSRYAFEKLFINFLIYAQTLYWEKHKLTVIWSSHEELPGDLDELHKE